MKLWPFKPFVLTVVPRSSKMKEQMLAKIAAAQAERDQLQKQMQEQLAALDTQINADTQKLNSLLAEIPTEFHNMTQEIFDKLKAYFN
jgi:DNA anti-recombination protein RmuC